MAPPRNRRSRVHPRMRGGSGSQTTSPCRAKGPSPHARGKRVEIPPATFRGRSIPACAGEAADPSNVGATSGVHPRMRGGSAAIARPARALSGPSPHARGKPRSPSSTPAAAGSIPACAGEASSSGRCCVQASVHPRMRGGSAMMRGSCCWSRGPSPHARGKRRRGEAFVPSSWSIPACAGEAVARARQGQAGQVHPRMRGGSASAYRLQMQNRGPSPHARGKPLPLVRHLPKRGSIPACAGEASAGSHPIFSGTVHPRMRGGSGSCSWSWFPIPGPSPYARGKRPDVDVLHVGPRSIPACAGEASG